MIYGINTKETRVNQAFGGSLELFKTGRLNVSLHDTARPTTDPATSEITAFVKRVNNNFGASARYSFSPKTSAAFDYGQIVEYYLDDNYKSFNYFQQTFSPADFSSPLSQRGQCSCAGGPKNFKFQSSLKCGGVVPLVFLFAI